MAMNYKDPSELNRALMKQGMMYPGDGNMKKRKFYCGAVEELNQPAPKHKCGEVSIGSECDTLMIKALDRENVYAFVSKGAVDMDLLSTHGKSTQDSNCFPRHPQSSAVVKFDASFRKADSYGETSASWSNAVSGISRLDSRISNGVWDEDEEIVSSNGEHSPCQNLGWPDIDCVEECFSAEHCKDNQQTAEGLEEFLSSTGINQTLFLQSSERWSLDQEAQTSRHRPTIDQEFEQYFSMLML